MCARYTVFSEEEIIEMRSIIDEVSRRFGGGAVGTGEIRPTDSAPVLTMDGGGLVPRPVSWGFPKRDGKGVVYNARSESALQRPMFSKALLTRRCVVPAAGFYEWAQIAAPEAQCSFLPPADTAGVQTIKTKRLFRRPDEPMLYMAGMMSRFADKEGRAREVFVILTTAANASMSPFHDRMPVLLSSNEREDWLQSDVFMRHVLTRVCPALTAE